MHQYTATRRVCLVGVNVWRLPPREMRHRRGGLILFGTK